MRGLLDSIWDIELIIQLILNPMLSFTAAVSSVCRGCVLTSALLSYYSTPFAAIISKSPPPPPPASCHVQFGSLVQDDDTHTKPLTLLRYTLPCIIAESNLAEYQDSGTDI